MNIRRGQVTVAQKPEASAEFQKRIPPLLRYGFMTPVAIPAGVVESAGRR
jgi:hypothetical protein